MSLWQKMGDWWRRMEEQAREAERQKKNKREEVEVPTTDPAAAAIFEHKYVANHPCLCGGKWQMISHDSPIPSGTSGMVCSCTKCGNEKVFVFRLW